jgi:hypothetical protein
MLCSRCVPFYHDVVIWLFIAMTLHSPLGVGYYPKDSRCPARGFETAAVNPLPPRVNQQDGLLHVITALEIMCGEKASHIMANWQDRDTARPWRQAEGKLGTLAHEIEKLGI